MKRLSIILLSVIMLISSVSIVLADDTSEILEENPLKGKKVLFVGDSICEGWCEWNDPTYGNKVAWAGRIIAEYEMYGVNKSLGGASISNCRKDNTVINQLKKMEGKTFDLVILQGGANDAWDSCPVGRINDTNFDGPYNNATFAGGLEETIKYAKETFPDAKIAYIITFSMPKASYGYLSNMSGLVKMTKKVCDKWDIPYLDLYNDEDLNKNQLKTDTTECLYDYIHPNSKGYNILAPIIGEWMKTLYSPTPEESEEESFDVSPDASLDESKVSATPSEDTSNSDIEPKNNIAEIVIISLAVVAVATVIVVLIRKKKK